MNVNVKDIYFAITDSFIQYFYIDTKSERISDILFDINLIFNSNNFSDLDNNHFFLTMEMNSENTIPHFDLINNLGIYHIFLYDSKCIYNGPQLTQEQLNGLNNCLKKVYHREYFEGTYWDKLCEVWDQLYNTEYTKEKIFMPNYTEMKWNK